jgi:hypothetical protein
VPRHPPNALKRLIRSSFLAHRDQTPLRDRLSLDLTLSTSFVTRLAVEHPSPPHQHPRFLEDPNARQPAPTASRIPIHNVKQQSHRTEIRGQRSVSCPATSPNFYPHPTEPRSQKQRTCPLFPVLRLLVEPNSFAFAGSGGADRDRTGDLLLAKQALSQLSYGPGFRRQSSDYRGQSHEIR